MAMDAGSVAAGGVGSGLAKELYDNYIPKLGNLGVPPASTAAQQKVADLCNSIAQTVIPHIVANAEVTQPVGPTDAGLQVSTAPGSPTGPNPALPVLGLPLGIKGTVA